MVRSTPYANLTLFAVFVITTAGCAAYRVSSNLEPAPASLSAPAAQILVTEGGLPDRKYIELGPIEVSVKKLMIFDKDPTREHANQALVEKASRIGADAVIHVEYTSGIGLATWGYIDAKGIGVKFTE